MVVHDNVVKSARINVNTFIIDYFFRNVENLILYYGCTGQKCLPAFGFDAFHATGAVPATTN
jgi:hypothetical protein